jgi:hypothetical protein
VEEIKDTYILILNMNKFLLNQILEIESIDKILKKKVQKSLNDTKGFIKLLIELENS